MEIAIELISPASTCCHRAEVAEPEHHGMPAHRKGSTFSRNSLGAVVIAP
jgi:hypothetical protein